MLFGHPTSKEVYVGATQYLLWKRCCLPSHSLTIGIYGVLQTFGGVDSNDSSLGCKARSQYHGSSLLQPLQFLHEALQPILPLALTRERRPNLSRDVVSDDERPRRPDRLELHLLPFPSAQPRVSTHLYSSFIFSYLPGSFSYSSTTSRLRPRHSTSPRCSIVAIHGTVMLTFKPLESVMTISA